jgi:hypothetical protein
MPTIDGSRSRSLDGARERSSGDRGHPILKGSIMTTIFNAASYKTCGKPQVFSSKLQKSTSGVEE